MKIENKMFTKVLQQHKHLITSIASGKAPIMLFRKVRDQARFLKLCYAGFKCENCGTENNLSHHHLFKKENKKYLKPHEYYAIRLYWYNQQILCTKCHAIRDEKPESMIQPMSAKKMKEYKKKFEKGQK